MLDVSVDSEGGEEAKQQAHCDVAVKEYSRSVSEPGAEGKAQENRGLGRIQESIRESYEESCERYLQPSEDRPVDNHGVPMNSKRSKDGMSSDQDWPSKEGGDLYSLESAGRKNQEEIDEGDHLLDSKSSAGHSVRKQNQKTTKIVISKKQIPEDYNEKPEEAEGKKAKEDFIMIEDLS